MKTNKNKLQPVMIGIFVVLSLLLLMIGIVLFGGGKLFSKENLVITYFDDSLKGLSVGAPVTYRGVSIGQVKEIKIQIDGDGTHEHEVVIPIIIALSGDQSLVINDPSLNGEQDVDVFLEAMCRQGLRAKLKTISLVTGKKYIDLAMHKGSLAVYQDRHGKYLEIPTLPSDMQKLNKVLENMDLVRLYSKIEGTFDSLNDLTKGLAQTLNHEKTQQMVDNLSTATANLNGILAQIDTGIGPLLDKVDGGLDNIKTLTNRASTVMDTLDSAIQPVSTSITKTLANLDDTLLQADQLLQQAEQTLHPASPLYHRLSQTLEQLEATSSSIEKLSNFISRNPDSLIFGLQQTGENNE